MLWRRGITSKKSRNQDRLRRVEKRPPSFLKSNRLPSLDNVRWFLGKKITEPATPPLKKSGPCIYEPLDASKSEIAVLWKYGLGRRFTFTTEGALVWILEDIKVCDSKRNSQIRFVR